MSIQFCVSEQEAKSKFCCLKGPAPDFQYCAGSTCMAWRWAEIYIFSEDGGSNKPVADTHGYCGLAGIPTDPGRWP